MPPPRTTKRWEHPYLRYAYVREYRGMACTVIHGSGPVSTGLKFTPAARQRALKILEERYDRHVNGVPALPPSKYYAADAFNRFKKERFEPRGGKKPLSRSIQLQIIRAFKRLVPGGIPLSNHMAIRDAIEKAISQEKWADNTKRGILKRLREVFAFAIAEGMMTHNPVRADLIPDETLTVPKGYTEEEFTAMYKALPPRHAAFIAVMWCGGLRNVEVIRITAEDVHDDHIVVRGKETRKAHMNRRVVPFALCPGLKEALELGREPNGESGREPNATEWFGLRSYYHVQGHLRTVCEELGIEYRGLYPLRYAAVTRWMRAGWDERLMEAVAGHSTSTSKKHYREPWTAKELVEMAGGGTP